MSQVAPHTEATRKQNRQQSKHSVRWLAAALATALIIGLLGEMFPPADAAHVLASVPANGIGFASREVPITSAELTRLEKVDVLKRLYQVGDQRFLLMVIDASKHRHAVHDPMYCFHGGGWQLSSEAELPLSRGSVRYVRMNKEGQTAEMLYWFSDGRTNYSSMGMYWWQTTLRRLTFGGSGAEPVMITMQPVGFERVDWQRVFNSLPFIAEI